MQLCVHTIDPKPFRLLGCRRAGTRHPDRVSHGTPQISAEGWHASFLFFFCFGGLFFGEYPVRSTI